MSCSNPERGAADFLLYFNYARDFLWRKQDEAER